MKVTKNKRQRRLPKQASIAVYPAKGSGFTGSCPIRCFKRANFNLQGKNFDEIDEKQMAKTFAKTSVRRSLFTPREDLVLQAFVLYAASREPSLTYKRKTSMKVTKNEWQRRLPKQVFGGHFNFSIVAC